MKSHLAVYACVFALGVATSADAALISRLGGQAVYDTDLDMTWLSDANLALTETFGIPRKAPGLPEFTFGIQDDGSMNWETANSWIAAMNADQGTGYLGFSDWRLPKVVIPDTCSTGGTNPIPNMGVACTLSDMGHLFYIEFEATGNTSVFDTGNPDEISKFNNLDGIGSRQYIYGDLWEQDTDQVMTFQFAYGTQGAINRNFNNWAWAVRDGDVAAVPVPPALYLFGSGLLGLIGVSRRKKAA